MSHWPEDVGILGMEFYFPSQYVDQNDLEKYDNVSQGKYTIGLGQSKMGFCTDLEDINSICLTVLSKLMETYELDYRSVGRLEVGTETLVDKSKSVKTVLMELFASSGNFSVEGVDTTNACYGGTNALFNAIAWIESSYWDGRYAVVVCGDIAVYAEGNARPTGGAGAIAMLVGPNAPLVFDRHLRATYIRHAYDFFKPDLTSEYPVVDGKLSIECYLSALDNCYDGYREKYRKRFGVENVSLDDFDAVLFHTPFCKLVQKSFARLSYNDFLNRSQSSNVVYDNVSSFENLKREETYFSREIEQYFLQHSKGLFEKLTKSSLYVASQLGNTYTPSLYGCLISLLIQTPIDRLVEMKKSIVLFSYGSGLSSSMFSLRLNRNRLEALKGMCEKLRSVEEGLNRRECVSAERFTQLLSEKREVLHAFPYVPANSKAILFDKTFYLTRIDEMHRRYYDRYVKGDEKSDKVEEKKE